MMINVVLIAILCPPLLAEGNPLSTREETTDLEALSATLKQTIQSVRPLSFEELLARAQPQQVQPNLHQYPTPPVFHATQKAKGLIFASIGGGLIATGVMAAWDSWDWGCQAIHNN